jgi:hypothetical protein
VWDKSKKARARRDRETLGRLRKDHPDLADMLSELIARLTPADYSIPLPGLELFVRVAMREMKVSSRTAALEWMAEAVEQERKGTRRGEVRAKLNLANTKEALIAQWRRNLKPYEKHTDADLIEAMGWPPHIKPTLS